ncbi:MAG: glycoside hydrolase family 2 protein [Ignavibacteria bacterium]|jgi:beta-mannosidase
MKKIFIIFLFILSCNSFLALDRIYLNDNWEFHKVGDSKWLPATVPGTVHTDLYNNGVIPDPFYRDNEKDLQWIENEDWEYQTEFYISDTINDNYNIDIKFEGLDTYATIYINDHSWGSIDNMFESLTCNSKSDFKKGKNIIKILFESPIKKAKGFKIIPQLPGGERIFTRKAAYQYGWDFGPRFLTCGIWRPIYIEIWKKAMIDFVKYKISELDTQKALINIEIVLQVPDSGLYRIELFNSSDILIYEKEEKIGDLISDTNPFGNFHEKFSIEIKNPKLWWCNGLGEPYLYNFKVVLRNNKVKIDEYKFRLGLRKIELVNEEDSIGSSFYFKLNGVPVFIKGANYIPQDNFIPRVSINNYKRIINDVKESNFNMLRVWGGGIYENDEFYDLCDEKGIMVWQDFMLANALYPDIDNFYKTHISGETWGNAIKLSQHPCLALFCGNNEIDEGWHNWGWQKEFNYSAEDSENIWANYTKLFDSIIPWWINRPDSLYIPYIPTSPKIGWGHPEAMKEGDSHYWGVWWGMEPFEIYEKKVPRFMSEYGFQSFPDMKTIEQFTLPEDRYLYSPVMKAHEKHPTGYETIQTYMEREYNQPKDLESYVYVSQLLQAYGVKRAIEAHRRAKPYCWGTMYWQLNDCWPGVTWSGIDYYGRWKALQYFAKEVYRDILISVKQDNDSLKVYIVSDRMQLAKGELKMKLLDFDGNILWNNEIPVSITGNTSEVYFKIYKTDLLRAHRLNNIVLSAELVCSDSAEYKNLYYFVPPKELELTSPDIKYKYDKLSGELVLTSEKLAKNVHLYIKDIDKNLSNNYFDILPGETVRIKMPEEFLTGGVEKHQIKLTSLYDTFEK